MPADRHPIAAFVGGVAIVCASQIPAAAQAPTRTWSSIMYLGGAAGVRGKSLDWDNKLTVGDGKITFVGKKNNLRFEIETASVRRLDYTGRTHSSEDKAFAFLVGGLAGIAVASAMRSTDHYLALEYALSDGSVGAVLFRLHKDNRQQIIDAIHEATGIAK